MRRLDPEEARFFEFASLNRRALGAFYTPAPLVQVVFDAVAPYLPRDRSFSIIDPACGPGAFLAEAQARYPQVPLYGLELAPEVARASHQRLPFAHVDCGDALRGALAPLLSSIPPGTFELWIGNPPYNGTSNVLKDAALYRQLCGMLPDDVELPAGTSLRDDFAFFLLMAMKRLEERDGAIAFITSSTLIDSFLYRPLRQALCTRLSLRAVLDLGGDVFSGARVRTCVTIWTRERSTRPASYRARDGEEGGSSFSAASLGPAVDLSPASPDYLLRPVSAEARALDQTWRSQGEPLTTLVPLSFTGLKTRFDELWVDSDEDRLFSRIRDFLHCEGPDALARFADAHDLNAHAKKLAELHAHARHIKARPARRFLRPFWRYAGRKHNAGLPEEARAVCYLDRRLIPRGDHRFRGDYDPHQHPVKLIFNIRELPLSSVLLERPGCVHDYRHARFAPLRVPVVLHREGIHAAKPGANLGPDVDNLSALGNDWVRTRRTADGSRILYAAIAAFIRSTAVQDIWAPAFGAHSILPVPVTTLEWAGSSRF